MVPYTYIRTCQYITSPKYALVVRLPYSISYKRVYYYSIATIPDLNNVGSRPPSSKKGKEAAPAAAAAKKGKVDPNLPPPIIAFR